MKQNNMNYGTIKICILSMCMCLLLGCAKTDVVEITTEEVEVTEENTNEEEAVRVDNVKDFLEAIAPGATITFSPGYYNLSEYTEEIWNKEGEEWNRNHPYVKLRECYDGGIEVVIQNVDGIFITGDLESAVVTELVVETRYGAVLNFEDCNNVVLNGLTMGHTQEGACDESVLTFVNSTDIHLSAMDLYGCGMYGFSAMNGSGNVYVQSSIIRDCEAGPFYITEPIGKYEFRDCWLIGSFGGGHYEPVNEAALSFVECSFGEQETNYWYFNEDAVFIDCQWEEITEYPDVEPEEGDYLDVDSLELMPVNGREEELVDTYYAYMVVDQQSGDTVYYPHFTLQLSEDGTGYCETEDDYFEFTWYCEEDILILESDIYYYLTPYVGRADGYDQIWFMMQMNEDVIWIY